MHYPYFSDFQSETKGKKRLTLAIENLGADVVNKMLIFTLYTLGLSYEFISQNTEFSEPGIKTLIQDVYENGIERFLDKRKKLTYSTLKKEQTETTIKPTVEYVEKDKDVQFILKGSICLKLRRSDKIGIKLLSLLLLDADLLKQVEVANILNCKRLSVYQNHKKYKCLGIKGLIDERKGHNSDYKFNHEVKSEIIKGYILNITENNIPTKTTISNHLNETFSNEYSERAVALHLKKIGLSDNKKETISEIARQINVRVDSLEYLNPWDQHTVPMDYIEPLKRIREALNKEFDFRKPLESFFQIEEKVESLGSSMHALILKSLINEMKNHYICCPNCHSSNINILEIDEKTVEQTLKTSLGSNLILPKELLIKKQCNECKIEFDFVESMLKLPKQIKYTPLTQKKICSSNRAGSYENGTKNLKELIALDINRNQVRKISNSVGEYIIKEFNALYKDIVDKMPATMISQRHPLVKKLKINKKYLDKTKYLIVFAIDGGRMQLFNWIPPSNENEKAKKKLYWHENKVFRISIYDKTTCEKIFEKNNGSKNGKTYKAAKIIQGLTTYGATNVSWKEAAQLVKSHLYIRGIKPEDVQICLSDGSEHIMNEIFTTVFPKSTHILDYYHKAEALHACLKVLDIDDGIGKNLKNFLWEGSINKLIKELKKIQLKVGMPTGKRNPDNPKVKLDNFINHLTKNKNRIKYNQYRKQKYPIGSGSVESAVKMFGKRIKGTEKQWNGDGGEKILNLYAFLLSEDDRWNKLWQFHFPWLL